MNLYNEIDPFAAAWLRELIKAGHIAPGVVDERSIEDITPDELKQYTQCHFFAGIGVWSYALRCAGWPDDRPVWTGSCPCQPFSTAGKRKGTADERHLWPHLYHLISQCKPASFFGEQVASKDGLTWFDTVQADLEGSLYAVAVCDFCAASVGAPHIRQRLYFVAESLHSERRAIHKHRENGCHGEDCGWPEAHSESGTCGEVRVNLDNTTSQGLSQRPREKDYREEARSQFERPGYTRGFWAGADWISCLDDRYRPTEPGSFPLVDGSPNRVGRLRGYGNAIVAPQAQAFIEAYLEHEQAIIEGQGTS